VLRVPPEDAVIADYALDALESAIGALGSDLGFEPKRMIHVDIYRAPTDLASVSTLTAAEVENTGTIALCKWARLMATTPRALRFGYPWLDSLSHELVHYVVSTLSHDRAPVWMQEGLAKFLERRWRDPAGPDLPPSMQHLLAKGLASGKLISFEAMHPSMAKLPHAEDAALAFAEVATAIGSLHAKGGMEALRAAIAKVRDGVDARTAVAQAGGGSWPQFEKGWKAYMAAQHYRTFPGLEPVTRKFRKPGALASKRGPSEDEAVSGADPGARYLRLGNMLLLRNRPKAATVEYERGGQGGPRAVAVPGEAGPHLPGPGRSRAGAQGRVRGPGALPRAPLAPPHRRTGAAGPERAQEGAGVARGLAGGQPLRPQRPLRDGRCLPAAAAGT
jgi:hypothetical protein